MTTQISSELIINAPKPDVWKILANLETVQDYDAEVVKSFYVSDVREGIGASRQCDLPHGEYMRERVIDWEDGESYAITVYEETLQDFPFTNQVASFALTEVQPAQTLVSMRYEYELKSDTLDEVDALQQTARDLVSQILVGLKKLAETGEQAQSPHKTT